LIVWGRLRHQLLPYPTGADALGDGKRYDLWL
jgi:hypothetical protein